MLTLPILDTDELKETVDEAKKVRKYRSIWRSIVSAYLLGRQA